MKQKLLFLAILSIITTLKAQYYDFSAISPGGQQLYYTLSSNNTVSVVSPNYSNWNGHTKPSDTLEIPESVNYMGVDFTVTSIGQYAFSGCNELSSVIIPSTVNEVGSYAFSHCTSLLNVYLPSTILSINSYSFYCCTSLTNVLIPETVTSIGERAFSTSGLTSIVIPNSVTSIGQHAFTGCDNLTSVIIGAGVSSIEYNSFWGNRLNSITVSDQNEHYDSRENCNAIVETSTNNIIIGCQASTIPSSILSIGSHAFDHCRGLQQLVIPSNIITIGQRAFDGCIDLASLIISDNVEVISDYAFSSCTHLSSITIGSGITSISGTAFFECTNVAYLQYNCSMAVPIWTTNLRHLVIGDSVSTIPPYEFSSSDSLRTVIIGSNVSSIGANAFYHCINLDTIYAYPLIPPSLGEDAFLLTPPSKVVVITCDADYISSWGSTGFNYTTGGFSLSLNTNNDQWGTDSFIQAVNCQQSAVIQANPFENCIFLEWSDGVTINPRTITLFKDSALTAFFAKNNVSVIVQSSNDDMGSTFGSGTYSTSTPIHINAVPNCGYRFSHWQDNDTNNPRHITLFDDTIFTAFFVLDRDTLYIHDTTYINVPFPVHDTAYITVHDTTYITLTDTVTNTIYDTTYVDVHDTTIVTDTLWLTQTDTLWLHDTVVVHDTVYITQEGIGDVEAASVKMYSSQGQIVVEGAEGNTVALFDVSGRMLATRRDDLAPLRFDVPASGTYMLRIGNHPARKVVVIR